jgi:hypothetical protein
MRNFRKSDMRCQYSWTASKEKDNKRIVDFDNNHTLYRTEGYEVLPFISRYMKTRGLQDMKTFHMLEAVIQNELPESLKGHAEIKVWLENNIQSLN